MHRVHPQVSLRSDANARLLVKNSFNYSINMYWVQHRSRHRCPVVGSTSAEPRRYHDAVQRFRARAHDGDVGQSFFTFSDAAEHFLNQWEAMVSGA